MLMDVRVGDIIPISTVDWKGHCSMVIFLAGCPFNCIYCSNPQFLGGGVEMPVERVLEKIDQAKPFIDSVVLSGGEPFLQTKAVEAIGEHCYDRNIELAVQTNGLYPDSLVDNCHLYSAVMLDIKAPPLAGRYPRVVRKPEQFGSFGFFEQKIVETAGACQGLRRRGDLKYWEVRTVIFRYINDDFKELFNIYSNVKDCDAYYLVQGNAEIAQSKGLEEVDLQQLREYAAYLVYHPKWVEQRWNAENVWIRSRAGEERYR
jgi:anaerobic ribonucleoside-triphosphate reductase activating protein